MPCTVIQPNDMADRILDRNLHPDWKGERTRLINVFPTNEKLWAEYAQIRADHLRAGGDGSKATEFYAQNRAAMDEGAEVAWPERFNEDELSAVQYAMNLQLRDRRAFWAEYQNAPLSEDQLSDEEQPDAKQILAKLNGYERGLAPPGVEHVTAFIDVQQKVLYWMLCGWAGDFTGYILDYGAWPDQQRDYFTLSDVRTTLAMRAPKSDLEGTIYNGLSELCGHLLTRQIPLGDGGQTRVSRCLIDANWGRSTDVVYQFCRESVHAAILMPSHGRYIGATSQPMADYRNQKGDRVGNHWRIPSIAGKRQVRHVLFDSNWWKSFAHERLRVTMGDATCLSLFERDPHIHRMLSEQLCAEYKIKVEARGRKVEEWKLRPERPDNHFLDCLIGCAVGASMQGSVMVGADGAGGARRRKITRESYAAGRGVRARRYA